MADRATAKKSTPEAMGMVAPVVTIPKAVPAAGGCSMSRIAIKKMVKPTASPIPAACSIAPIHDFFQKK